jgi:transcriptional regulator NrdR family protein
MKVKKRDGKLEEFDKNKIIRVCKRAGASEKEANDAVESINNEIYDGISTEEIRLLVLRELHRRNERAAFAFRDYKK